MKPNISAVVVTFNEEKNIKNCLDSLKWVDEIVVVDDGSTDGTLAIVKKYTSKIFHHKSVGYVEPVRNFAIGKASHPWVLLLDADETIPPSLKDKLLQVAEEEQTSFVEIPRKNIIFSEWIKHAGWWPDYQIRFFRKDAVVWSDKIHSKPQTQGAGIQLDADDKLAIHHENYQSISQFLQKLDRYTSREADEIAASDKRISWKDLVIKPSDEFLSRFFAREGYKDGLHGMVLSFLEAVSAHVLFAKLWERHGFSTHEETRLLEDLYKTFQQKQAEYEYWFLTALIEKEKNILKKNQYKFKRSSVRKKLQAK
jgi:glycosyltransferase involved in cell wall biosynthesis